MKITRPITEPPRSSASWDERWRGHDQGLIACWERGREKSGEDPALADQARAGQLVALPWKGGVENITKQKQKVGTMFYLAMWQGLRGDDLDVDMAEEVALTCTVTGMTVVFTHDMAKYAEA